MNLVYKRFNSLLGKPREVLKKDKTKVKTSWLGSFGIDPALALGLPSKCDMPNAPTC